MIAIGGYAGLRFGEVLGLTWDNIDEINKTITVNKQWNIIGNNTSETGFKKTKTENSNRTIPIPDRLLKILLDYKKYLNLDILPNRIFSNYTTCNSGTLNSHMRKVGYDITFHTLRHSYATTLLSEGLDIKTVASLLGDTISTVSKTYVHYSEEMRLKASESIKNIYT